MNKTHLIIGSVVVIAVAAGAVWYSKQIQDISEEAMEEEMMGEEEGMMEEDHSTMREHTIVFVGTAYSPREITIRKGDRIVFRNDSERQMWPASAMHPSHTAYPGSNIQKCETQERDSIFDACQGIDSGESWSFVFDHAGEWFFHDHLMPQANGKIIVQE